MNILSKFQLPSSYGLGMKVCWRYTELWRYFHIPLVNEWINDGGDCRTAPATPGVVMMDEDCWDWTYYFCKRKIVSCCPSFCPPSWDWSPMQIWEKARTRTFQPEEGVTVREMTTIQPNSTSAFIKSTWKTTIFSFVGNTNWIFSHFLLVQVSLSLSGW